MRDTFDTRDEARICDYASKRGQEEGQNAAAVYISAMFDRNLFPATTARALLAAIEHGDQEVCVRMPSCDLSGEWAERTNGPSLWKDALAFIEKDDSDEEFSDLMQDEVGDAYEAAFNRASDEAIRNECNKWVALAENKELVSS